MAAHRYWRIYVTANNYTGSSTGFREIELRESIGGADATGSGTAAADSSFSGSFLPAKAFDNGTGEWASGTGALPHWISYDFGAGADKDIVEMAWRPRTALGQEPIDFDLQWSDDNAAWTTLFSVRGYTDQSNDGTTWSVLSANTGIMAATTAFKQAWRVRVTAADGGSVFDISDIEMRLTAGGSDQCSGGAAFASSAYDGAVSGGVLWGAKYAFDASLAQPDWESNSGLTTAWVAYQFAAAKDITEVAIRSRDSADFNQAPKDFTVDYWDGSAWVVAMTLTGITGWTQAQTRYFNASGETSGSPATTARPVVFVCT